MNRNGLSLSILLVVLAAGAALASSPAFPVLAQEETPVPDSRCRNCHENLYFLHDSGQWRCFCEPERTCTCCHGGNPEAVDPEIAHEGLVANPVTENPAICQDCHPDDYAERILRFSHAAGIEPTPLEAPTGTPRAPVWAGSAGEGPPSPLLAPQPITPWQTVALGLLGGAFLATVLFGYLCWRADCLANITHTREKPS